MPERGETDPAPFSSRRSRIFLPGPRPEPILAAAPPPNTNLRAPRYWAVLVGAPPPRRSVSYLIPSCSRSKLSRATILVHAPPCSVALSCLQRFHGTRANAPCAQAQRRATLRPQASRPRRLRRHRQRQR